MSLHRRSVVRVSAERVLLVILALSILAGCGSAPRAATPPTPAPSLPPVATPVASTALPPATPAPATAIPTNPTALPTSSPAPTPAPTAPRFGPAWDDRTVYRQGLVPSRAAGAAHQIPRRQRIPH